MLETKSCNVGRVPGMFQIDHFGRAQRGFLLAHRAQPKYPHSENVTISKSKSSRTFQWRTRCQESKPETFGSSSVYVLNNWPPLGCVKGKVWADVGRPTHNRQSSQLAAGFTGSPKVPILKKCYWLPSPLGWEVERPHHTQLEREAVKH